MKTLFYTQFSAVAAAVALFGASVPTLADERADYPDHVKDEIRAADLEREARLVTLRGELAALHNAALDTRAKKFKEVLELLKTDQEIRALLKQSPELYPLYQMTLGSDAVAPPPEAGVIGTNAEFCGCLYAARVRWLGQKEQLGEAVLAFGDSLYDMREGDKIGGSLCVMRAADGKRAHLECRDPVQNKLLKRSIAMQKFHRIKAGNSTP